MRREKEPAGEMVAQRITTGDHKGNYGLVSADKYWDGLGRVAYEDHAQFEDEWGWEKLSPNDKEDWINAAKAVAKRIRDEQR